MKGRANGEEREKNGNGKQRFIIIVPFNYFPETFFGFQSEQAWPGGYDGDDISDSNLLQVPNTDRRSRSK